MVASKNLFLEQGSNFESKEMNLEVKESGITSPLDLTGKTLKAQMRRNPKSTEFFEFTVVVVDDTNGIIKLTMDNTITTDVQAARYVYDIFIVEDFEKILTGIVVVNPSATKLI